jgi:hypothetical protein
MLPAPIFQRPTLVASKRGQGRRRSTAIPPSAGRWTLAVATLNARQVRVIRPHALHQFLQQYGAILRFEAK